MSGYAGGLGDVGETAVAVVAKEGVGLGRVEAGMAEVGAAVDDAGAFGGGVPLDIVDDKEVEMAVAIVVEPSGADGPAAVVVKPGLRGDVFEAALAEVAIEGDAAEAGDEQIGEAVVVVVAGGGGDIVAGAGEAGGGGTVGKQEVTVVVEEAVGVSGGGLQAGGKGRAVGKEEVEEPVVIGVKDGDAAGHGGGQGVSGSFAREEGEGKVGRGDGESEEPESSSQVKVARTAPH